MRDFTEQMETGMGDNDLAKEACDQLNDEKTWWFRWNPTLEELRRQGWHHPGGYLPRPGRGAE